LARLVLLVLKVCRGCKAGPAQSVPQGRKATQVLPDPPDHKVLRGCRGIPDQLAHPGLKAAWDPPAPRVLPVHRAPRVSKDCRVRPAR
jgi:hypothetical protein